MTAFYERDQPDNLYVYLATILIGNVYYNLYNNTKFLKFPMILTDKKNRGDI